MNKKRKIFFWLAGGTGVLLLLFLAFLILLPWFVDSEPVKKKIESFISQRIEGKIEFQKVELSFFPYPLAGMDQVHISIPGRLKGTIGSLRIYPELRPLLKGEIRIAMFRIEAPNFTFSLPEKRPGKRADPLTLRTAQDKIASLLSALEPKIPGLRAEVTKGNFELYEAGQLVFSFRNIQGQFALPPGTLEVALSCSSNLFERFSLKGSLNPRNFKGEGSIRIDALLPHVVSGYFLPGDLSPVGESKIDINANFETDRPGLLQAEIEGSSPYFTVQRGKTRQIIKAGSVKAALTIDDDKTTVSLKRLRLDGPPLDLSGKFVMDHTASRITLEIEGRDLNMAPLREAALSIAGDVPIVQTICTIVKGGTVPRVLFQTWGSSMDDLGGTKTIFIKAGLRNGRIYLEGPSLDLQEANGDVVISSGILKGEGLEARLGNSWGRKGTLTLGLKGENAPFQLDVMVQADLAEAVVHLKRLIKGRSFHQEISRVSNIKGNATGRLVLGPSLSSYKHLVEVTGFQFTARYGPIPYAVEITQGQFTYDELNEVVRVKNLGGKVGRSSFSGMTAQFVLGKTPSLEIMSGKLLILLDEIYPWIASFQGVGNHLKEIRSTKGRMEVSQVRLQGPPSNPRDWRFDVTGEVKDVAVDTSLFKDPVRVTRGKFNVTPQKLSFTDLQGRLMDASLSASASLTQFLSGPTKAGVSFGGMIGAEATQWISKVAKLPPRLILQPPFSISAAHLTLEGEGATKISFQGKFTFENGGDVSMVVLVTPEELVIRDLLIQDKISRATIGLTLGKNVAVLKFAGELHGKTLDKILAGYELPAQWMKGNFQARILLDQPWLSTADGDIEGRDIHFTLKQIGDVEIDHVSLEAAKSNVRVNSAAFRWKNQIFSLHGVASVTPKGFEFDTDLSSQALEFDAVSQALSGKDEKSAAGAARSTQTPPIRGLIRFKTDRLTYVGFTWAPLSADVSFDNKGVSVQNIRGSLCGFSMPGSLKISDQGIEMNAMPSAVNQELRPAILCLTEKNTDITGTFSLNGRLYAKGESSALIRSLQGDIKFTASNGVILNHPVLARIFTFLNVTEVFRGRLPDFSQQGLVYDSITLDGEIREGKLLLKEYIIDGRTLDLIASGEIDLAGQTINVKVLVAPFKTVDFIVRLIPPLSYIFGGSLVSVPVSVTGGLRDPKVTVLPPSAVGSELLAPMKRILKLPFKVIDLFSPGQKTK